MSRKKTLDAAQQMNDNFPPLPMRRTAILVAIGLILLDFSTPAGAAAIKPRAGVRPDPILMGPLDADSPCFLPGPQAGYVAGVDVHGRPVESADLAQPFRVKLESETVFPEIQGRRGRGHPVNVEVTVRGLADAVSPPPACPLRR